MSSSNRGRNGGKRSRGGFSGQLSGSTPAFTPGGQQITTTTAANSGALSPPIVEPQAQVSTAAAEGDTREDDSVICFICAEPVKYFSIGVCNHSTCHVCALRLRALYKKNECTFCKTSLPRVIFSRTEDIPFEEHPHTSFKDERLQILFEDAEVMEDSLLLLRFNCPSAQCDFIAVNWADLRHHVDRVHASLLCDLCLRNKKIFSHEHELYPPSLLSHHMPSLVPFGRPLPKLMKGLELTREMGVHPLCEFCHECYFADEDLFKHMRERHEDCFLCKNNGITDQYFLNYHKLEQHFNNSHFPCTEPQCLEKKFVVFNSEFDLKGHQVQEHADSMTSQQLAAARRIDFSGAPSNNGPPTSRRNGGRGGNNNHSSSSHTQQHQQQRNLPPHMHQQQQQAGSVRRAAFGGNLTGGSTSGSSTPPSTQPTGTRSGDATPPSNEPVPDRETLARHAALLTRVSVLVNHSESKMAVFRHSVRSYRSNESTANDLIDTIYNILDRDVDVTGSIVGAVEGLLDGDNDKDKRKVLLESLNGWKADRRNEFPDLSPLGDAANFVGIASGRVLNLKKTTKNNSSTNRVWDRVERAASVQGSAGPSIPGSAGYYVAGASRPALSNANAFPSLSSGNIASSSRSNAVSATAWSASSAQSSGRSAAAVAAPRSVNFPVNNNGKGKQKAPAPPSATLFPSLPKSSASSSSFNRKELFATPSARNLSIQRLSGAAPAPPPGASWGGSSSATTTTAAASAPVASEPIGKKGKKKELLFTISARPT